MKVTQQIKTQNSILCCGDIIIFLGNIRTLGWVGILGASFL